MKLFDNFEAVKFPEENLILITDYEYLCYIYDVQDNYWKKHKNPGNDHITVSNYPDVSKEELMGALDGVFPEKETDFSRRCQPSQLRAYDLFNLLKEDYSVYMSNKAINSSVYGFLTESTICYKSYLKLRELFDNALMLQQDNEHTLARIKELSQVIIGRDIFKEEIAIVDGHDSSSYFWIMPVRVIDYTDTDNIDNVAEMRSAEISIEENDVDQYLTPFLYRYYDDELKANKNRIDYYWEDDDGIEQAKYVRGFEWNLSYNFYTYESIRVLLMDMQDTIEALSSGRETEYTVKLRKKRGWETHELLYAKDLSKEQIDEYNANRPTEDNTKIELIIDFYRRFIYRMEYMLTVGKEKGYDLISFMGP